MSFGKQVTWRRRIGRAAWALVINAVLWIVLPSFIAMFLAGRVSGTPITTPLFIYEFGALFIALDVGAALTEGMAVSVPLLSGVALLSAAYLWLATNGGDLAFSVSGVTIGLQFRLLVLAFIIPSLWGVLKAPLSYILWKRAPLKAPGQ